MHIYTILFKQPVSNAHQKFSVITREHLMQAYGRSKQIRRLYTEMNKCTHYPYAHFAVPVEVLESPICPTFTLRQITRVYPKGKNFVVNVEAFEPPLNKKLWNECETLNSLNVLNENLRFALGPEEVRGRQSTFEMFGEEYLWEKGSNSAYRNGTYITRHDLLQKDPKELTKYVPVKGFKDIYYRADNAHFITFEQWVKASKADKKVALDYTFVDKEAQAIYIAGGKVSPTTLMRYTYHKPLPQSGRIEPFSLLF